MAEICIRHPYTAPFTVQSRMNKVFFMTNQNVILLIEKCRDTREVDSHVILLREINASLPLLGRNGMPTLTTDDCRRRALEIVEDRISATLRNTTGNSLAISALL